jgi:hypothetical protein
MVGGIEVGPASKGGHACSGIRGRKDAITNSDDYRIALRIPAPLGTPSYRHPSASCAVGQTLTISRHGCVRRQLRYGQPC